VSTELIDRARPGDGDAFRQLTDPHRRELQVHCYRILGSMQDAEDALQDTLLAAWQGLSGFEQRASLRTWLYRVATSRCLNALRSASRRPHMDWSIPDVEPLKPTRLGEVVWLEPCPDVLLDGLTDNPPGPEARYETSEVISLAFVAALQLLPARQRAVLILRDVLGFHANEAADMLDTTVESVTSALKRARATLGRRLGPDGDREPPPAPNSPVEAGLVAGRRVRGRGRRSWRRPSTAVVEPRRSALQRSWTPPPVALADGSDSSAVRSTRMTRLCGLSAPPSCQHSQHRRVS
jgi:RNA polymerase sigma-70 factor (TIGR02960 family)